MKVWKAVLFIVVSTSLVISNCSRKKEEAAQLEQEMMPSETTTVDTAATYPARDTFAEAPGEIDAGAVPRERESGPEVQEDEAGGYVVQVAACESADYAQYLVDKYEARGYEPYVTTVTIEGQWYYRVRIGGFETLAEAQALQSELADKYSSGTWIDRTE